MSELLFKIQKIGSIMRIYKVKGVQTVKRKNYVIRLEFLI